MKPLAELHELRRVVYMGNGKKTITTEYLKALTPLALAIWFMDDGTFTVRSKGVQQRTQGGSGRVEICVEAFTEGSRQRLVDYLRDDHPWTFGSVTLVHRMWPSSSSRLHLRRGSWSWLRHTSTRPWTTSSCRIFAVSSRWSRSS